MSQKDVNDLLMKVILPVAAVILLYSMFIDVFTKDGVTNWFYMWIVCGIPFGIWRMYIWLVPHGFGISGSLGVWALNFIVGGLIGGIVIIWLLLRAICYLVLFIYRLAKPNNDLNKMQNEE